MEDRDLLRSKMIDEEMQRKQNVVYTRFLTSVGLIIILGVAVAVVLNELVFTPAFLAFFVIGLILSLSGIIWNAKDLKEMKEAEEKFQDLGNDEEESERFGTYN